MMTYRETFVKRANTHQTHFEDLVLLGPDGIDEIKDKIEKFLDTVKNGDNGSNYTTKIDGCLHPDTFIKTTEGDKSFSEIIANKSHTYYGYGKNSSGDIVEIELKFPRISNDNNKDWYNITFDNDGYVICTQNHPFSVKDTFVEAENLKIGDDIDTL